MLDIKINYNEQFPILKLFTLKYLPNKKKAYQLKLIIDML